MVTVLGNEIMSDIFFLFGLICAFPFSPLYRTRQASSGCFTRKATCGGRRGPSSPQPLLTWFSTCAPPRASQLVCVPVPCPIPTPSHLPLPLPHHLLPCPAPPTCTETAGLLGRTHQHTASEPVLTAPSLSAGGSSFQPDEDTPPNPMVASCPSQCMPAPRLPREVR